MSGDVSPHHSDDESNEERINRNINKNDGPSCPTPGLTLSLIKYIMFFMKTLYLLQ
jgi:hypothetical protein